MSENVFAIVRVNQGFVYANQRFLKNSSSRINGSSSSAFEWRATGVLGVRAGSVGAAALTIIVRRKGSAAAWTVRLHIDRRRRLLLLHPLVPRPRHRPRRRQMLP